MKIALVALTLVLPSVVFGMVFKWTDSAGISHYTNKEYEIPARYRAKAKHLYPEQADTLSPQQDQQTQQAAKPEIQTQPQQIPPEGQTGIQPPTVISGQQKQKAKPANARRRRGTAPDSSEE